MEMMAFKKKFDFSINSSQTFASSSGGRLMKSHFRVNLNEELI